MIARTRVSLQSVLCHLRRPLLTVLPRPATFRRRIRVGATAGREWTGARRPIDLYDAKADAEAVLAAAGAPVGRLMTFRDAPDWYHPGRSAMLKLGPKNPLCAFGELHPKVVEAMDVKGPVVAMELFLENIPFPKAKGSTRPALVASDFQAVERDFAFVVDAEVEAGGGG